MFSLGLGLPIHRIPIMTILLTVFCTWKYITIDISNNKKFDIKHQQISKKMNKSEELMSLRKEYCQQFTKRKIDCSTFAKDIKTSSKIKKKSYLLDEQKLKIQFNTHLKNKSAEVTGLSSYQNFDDLNSSFQRELIPWYEEINLLSFENQNLKSYLNSMFTHSGSAHLIGNMMALIVFGIYVEAKVGAVVMLSSSLLIFSSINIKLLTFPLFVYINFVDILFKYDYDLNNNYAAVN